MLARRVKKKPPPPNTLYKADEAWSLDSLNNSLYSVVVVVVKKEPKKYLKKLLLFCCFSQTKIYFTDFFFQNSALETTYSRQIATE